VRGTQRFTGGWHDVGSGHGADARGRVEERVPKLLGVWVCDDDASLGRAADR
jgi:hypothetical protein